ncbi:coenzyme F420 hydrogenase [Exiguobacterium sp. SH1S21]|uniref:Coenzyme F420 hydrogenase/dehydrogenase, beta subunit C-terminal domain n=1 Tax=Exiguobacterium sp. SH1S21 TaxID=2510953 RepID=UPI00103C4EF3|nr:Coenzyme F420 hydrogenase/dehydrogenase, beta subunit C-terminal domain [Exiguobacterium sp. SH1S21]TCI57445.1 coenzyme F420 hydrogenase [Exiguobacterium sp. SH1S21]
MKSSDNVFSTIVKNGYSFGTGIFTVINKDIQTSLNEFGEYKPNYNNYLDKDSLNLLSKVCLNSKDSKNEDEISENLFGNIPDIKYDERVGYYSNIYAGHVLEGDYRKNASSGGFGTWIFKELFERNLIDGVIHVKENKDTESPILFKYDISNSIEEIKAGAKTRYYPVEVSEVLEKVKNTEGRYAIVGTPSHIMSVRLLADYDPIIRERIKFTIGLICGHQKSTKFTDCLAWQVGIKPGDLTTIDYRKKILNEPSNQYSIEMKGTINGEEVKITKKMNELFGYNWGHGFFKSHASDFTDDVMNETADVTLGDAWLPEYTSDSQGNNVVLIRNSIIEKIICEGIHSKKIHLDQISLETLIQSQKSHFHHTRDELPYRLYKKDKDNSWRPEKRVSSSNDIGLFRKKVQDLRMEISTQSHIVFKKAQELNDFEYFVKHMNAYVRRYNRIYYIHSLYDQGAIKIIKKMQVKIIKKNFRE